MAADPPTGDAVAEFVGRGWLADAVRQWAPSESGYLFLTGGPGTGKSAAVDHLWGDAPVAGTAVYRCRAASRSSCDPVRFAESLAEQFSTTLPGFAQALARVARERSGRVGELRIEGTASAGTVHPDASVIGVRVSFLQATADEAFEQLVCRPLELLAPAERPVVVVDALDEALTYRGRRTIAELVLDGTDRIPLRFVLTSRHDARVTAAVRTLPDAVVLDLVDDAPDPTADLLAYARQRLRGTGLAGPDQETLARALAAHGEGNYLYVRFLTEELAAGTWQWTGPGDVGTLPRGLHEAYRRYLLREIRPVGSREAEERWRTDFRPVLALLVAARDGGFTTGRLADLLDRTEQEVLDALVVLGPLLRGRGPRGPWQFFHWSYAEFLVAGDDPDIDAGEGHRRIADHAFAVWADAWGSCDDAYLLRHLPDHLMSAVEASADSPMRSRTPRDRLYALATSPAYLAAQCADAPDREPHLETIRLALEASLAAHAHPRAARLALELVRYRRESDAVTPVRAAQLWGAAAGVAKARTYPQDTALLWLLMIVTALGARSPDDAADVLHEIASGGFGETDSDWSPAVAALLAPMVSRFTREEFAPVLDVADDELLGHLAAFLLEEAGPEQAAEPALRIREATARARAVAEILTHTALAAFTAPEAKDLDLLARLGTVMAAGHVPAQGETRAWDRLGSEPDVGDSLLLVHAARGELEEHLPQLAERFGRRGAALSDSAVLLARVIQAVRLGPDGVAPARAAGTAALARHPKDLRVLLYHTTVMAHIGDPAAPALCDALVEASHTVDDDLYAGHVDAFHGLCNVGLRLAVVRVLAAAGQTGRARQEADRLRTHHPAEHVRALAWLSRLETRPEQRASLVAAARETADRVPYSLCAQTALVLADGDRERLAEAVARTVTRDRHGPEAVGPARTALAWAAHVRGDQQRAETLGAEAAAWFTRLPQDRRRQQDADRLVKNLLRARLPAEAATVVRTPTRQDSDGLMYLGDVRHVLAAHGEFAELALLEATRVRVPSPGGSTRTASPYEQALTVSVLRAGGDRRAFEDACATLRGTIKGILGRLAQLPEDIGLHHGKDEEGAVWCLLQATRLQWPAAVRAATVERERAANRALFGSGGPCLWTGRYPREVENRDALDVMLRRRVQAAAARAEAFHDIGDDGKAASELACAIDNAGQVEGSVRRNRAFTELTATAVRLGRYADLGLLWREAARLHGASLGDVAETLVVTVLRGGPDAADARRALEEILGSPGLADLDHVDLIAALAVLTPGTEVEEHLLADGPAGAPLGPRPLGPGR
ncbi:hypothetical protein [Streptomyces sp. NPDC091268]|uniref:hypothetical protein n=1 Tax=Streptomyces sp. NPDC091268 TaxID=3365979 RepID=UPI00381B21AE